MIKGDKIATTRKEIKEIMTEVVKDSFSTEEFRNTTMETLVEFNVGKFIPERDAYFENDIKPFISQEIKTSEQKLRDWTDKRVGEAEGRIIQKTHTLTDILGEKDVIGDHDIRKIRLVGMRK